MADASDPTWRQKISAKISQLAKKGHLGQMAYQEVHTYGSIDPFRDPATAPKIPKSQGEFMQPAYQAELKKKMDKAMEEQLIKEGATPDDLKGLFD